MRSIGKQFFGSIFSFQGFCVLVVVIPITISIVVSGQYFSYDPHQKLGPLDWGHLYNNWTNCSLGHRQTPINIKDARVKLNTSLGPLRFQYKDAPGEAYQTGHGIKVAIEGDGGSLQIGDQVYNLIQFHWHWPSEHAINGKRHVMELHLVHSNPKGLAVVAILYDFGDHDPLLQAMIAKFRYIVGTQKLELGPIDSSLITFESPSYYRYIGSLTTPPCTEGVIWTVQTKVRQVSMEQLAQYEAIVNDSYTSTARPLQHLDGRLVFINTPKPCGS